MTKADNHWDVNLTEKSDLWSKALDVLVCLLGDLPKTMTESTAFATTEVPILLSMVTMLCGRHGVACGGVEGERCVC